MVVAEMLREVVELGATGRDFLGGVVETLPELTTVTKEVRGARELAYSLRLTKLRSGRVSVNLEHRSLLCSNGVSRGSIEALEEWGEGAGPRGRAYL